jgi:pseudaminic acid synthase
MQSLELAKETIIAMKESGADCVKLQTYKPETMTLDVHNSIFSINKDTLWDGMNLFELYKKAMTPWEWTPELKELTLSLGMEFFSSPFDKSAVDLLEENDVPAYKISSFEINDIPLIDYVAKKGKPIIISTGVAHKEDIDLAIETCKKNGNEDIILLKCTSGYPTPLKEVNLNNMLQMQKDYDCLVGVSDHTLGSIVPTSSIALGSKVIEKHFILNKNSESYDVEFSMDPIEFKEMVDSVRAVEDCLGTSEYVISDKKEASRSFMRSLFFIKDIKKGEIVTEDSVQSVRPADGLHPKYFEQIIGEVVLEDVQKNTPVEKKYFKDLV